MPPDTLRALVRNCIERHLPRHQMEILKTVEASERTLLRKFARNAEAVWFDEQEIGLTE
jgi:hypothetical protein